MSAQVISLNGQSRAVAHEARSEAEMSGFGKALALVFSLNGSSVVESKAAIQNWHAAEMLNRSEVDALMKFYGWEKLQS